MHLIDVHVLTHSGTVPEWLEKCVASIEDEPEFQLHIVKGEEGHIGAGRARGYQCGTLPYVTFVDSDDWVYPGVGAAMLSALERGSLGVCTLERLIVDAPGSVQMQQNRGGHGLWGWRREAIVPFLSEVASERYFPDMILPERVGYTQLQFLGRAYRIHPDQFSRWATRQVK